MKNLRNMLLRYKPLNLLGGSNLNKEQLTKDLIKLVKTNSIYFLICVIMVIIVFIIMIIFMISNNYPIIVKAISGSTGGITIGGLIVFMNRLWKEKVATDILIVLVINMNEKDINSIILILLEKLFSKQKIK